MLICTISSRFPFQVKASDDALEVVLWWRLLCLFIYYKVVISRWGGVPHRDIDNVYQKYQ